MRNTTFLLGLALSLAACSAQPQAPTSAENAANTIDSTAIADSAVVVSVAFTGDIMMGTTYPKRRLPADDGRQLFQDVAPVLRSVDLAAGNFEGTLCDGGTCSKKPSKHTFAFRTPTTYAPRLSEAGYDFLCLANNHANDFGSEGIRSTMHCLKAEGIGYSGIRGYQDHAIIERNGVKYGLCAFGHNGYTLRHQDTAQVRRIVTSLVDSCDIVIVAFHGGAEGTANCRLPYGTEKFLGEDRGNLREFAHLCIDAGADVVYGHGPHVVRAVELYKDRFIAYSLGNFCTPYGMGLAGTLGYAPVLTLRLSSDGTFRDGEIHSFLQHYGLGPRTDAQHHAAQEIRRLTRLDCPNTPLDISDEGRITRK